VTATDEVRPGPTPTGRPGPTPGSTRRPLPSSCRAHPHLSREDLLEATWLAIRLGWAARAANGLVFGDPGRTRQRLQMFLDGRVGAV